MIHIDDPQTFIKTRPWLAAIYQTGDEQAVREMQRWAWHYFPTPALPEGLETPHACLLALAVTLGVSHLQIVSESLAFAVRGQGDGQEHDLITRVPLMLDPEDFRCVWRHVLKYRAAAWWQVQPGRGHAGDSEAHVLHLLDHPAAGKPLRIQLSRS